MLPPLEQDSPTMAECNIKSLNPIKISINNIKTLEDVKLLRNNAEGLEILDDSRRDNASKMKAQFKIRSSLQKQSLSRL